MLQDLLGIPTAADIVPDDRVKQIAAVGTGRRAGTHDLLDLVDAVAAAVAAAVEAVAADRRSSFRSCSLAALAPHHGPVDARDRCW